MSDTDDRYISGRKRSEHCNQLDPFMSSQSPLANNTRTNTITGNEEMATNSQILLPCAASQARMTVMTPPTTPPMQAHDLRQIASQSSAAPIVFHRVSTPPSLSLDMRAYNITREDPSQPHSVDVLVPPPSDSRFEAYTTEQKIERSKRHVDLLDFSLFKLSTELHTIGMSAQVAANVSQVQICLNIANDKIIQLLMSGSPHAADFASTDGIEVCNAPFKQEAINAIGDLEASLRILRDAMASYTELKHNLILSPFDRTAQKLKTMMDSLNDDEAASARQDNTVAAGQDDTVNPSQDNTQLITDFGRTLQSLADANMYIVKDILPAIRVSQSTELFRPQTILAGATLLSSITATTLQTTLTLPNHHIDSKISIALNLCWLLSLICSITCAVHAMLSMILMQSKNRNPNSLVSPLAKMILISSPAWILLVAVASFAIGLYILPFAVFTNTSVVLFISPFYLLPLVVVGLLLLRMEQEHMKVPPGIISRWQSLRSRSQRGLGFRHQFKYKLRSRGSPRTPVLGRLAIPTAISQGDRGNSRV